MALIHEFNPSQIAGNHTHSLGQEELATEAFPELQEDGQDVAAESNTDFEVLGLMRTTSRTQDDVPSRRTSIMEDHISAIPENDHEEDDPKKSSLTGLDLLSKIKQKVPNMGFSKSDKPEKGHQKHDSATGDSDSFEVFRLIQTNTRTGEATMPVEESPALERQISSIPQDGGHEEKPTLERHISSIPQDGGHGSEAQDSGYTLPPQLKRHISAIPTHDYDSEGEHSMDDVFDPPAKVEKHDSGLAGSDFEVAGVLTITSNESGKSKSRSPTKKKPGLERHISSIPQDDDDGNDSMLRSTRLVKTISGIPGHDYDSDGEITY